MMFRKLYWITEQSDRQGKWRATGVYTSITDLVDHGIRIVGEGPQSGEFRITLVKLDCCKDVLGSWSGPMFEGLEADMEHYIETAEFGIDEIQSLRLALNQFAAAA